MDEARMEKPRTMSAHPDKLNIPINDNHLLYWFASTVITEGEFTKQYAYNVEQALARWPSFSSMNLSMTPMLG